VSRAVRSSRRSPRRRQRERGSAEVLGIALLAPVALGLALTIVYLGRGIDGRATVHGAAESAAQAAARARSAAAAVAAAERVGTAALVGHPACARPMVRVDTARFRPGGVVAVTVSCAIDRSGLELVAPGGPSTTRATAFAAIDPYRAAEGAP
jgi:Flp pilus assembly protein TadG